MNCELITVAESKPSRVKRPRELARVAFRLLPHEREHVRKLDDLQRAAWFMRLAREYQCQAAELYGSPRLGKSGAQDSGLLWQQIGHAYVVGAIASMLGYRGPKWDVARHEIDRVGREAEKESGL